MSSLAQPVPVATGDAILGKHASWAAFCCPIYFYFVPHLPPAVMTVSEILEGAYSGDKTAEMTDAAV